MSECFVYVEDGRCCVMYPAPGVDLSEFVARIGLEGVIVPAHTLPSTQLQGAWVLLDGKPVVDREAAYGLLVERLRPERAARLAELDVAFVRALERGEPTTEIVAAKQFLRDLPELDFSDLTLQEIATITLQEVITRYGSQLG